MSRLREAGGWGARLGVARVGCGLCEWGGRATARCGLACGADAVGRHWRGGRAVGGAACL